MNTWINEVLKSRVDSIPRYSNTNGENYCEEEEDCPAKVLLEPEWQRAEGQLGGVPGQGGAVGSSLLQHAEDGLATGQPGQPLRVWLPAGRGLLQRGVGLHS